VLVGLGACAAFAACAGALPPPQGSRLVVPAASGSARAAPAVEVLPDPADPATLDEAWRLWFAGRREPALARFRAVRRHLESREPRGDAGAPKGPEPGAAAPGSDARNAIVFATGAEMISCDRGGTPRARVTPGGQPSASPSSPAVLLERDGHAHALDAATLEMLTEVPTASGIPPALGEDAIAWFEAAGDDATRARVFDLATRKERWVSEPASGVHPTWIGLESGFVVAPGMAGALWDASTGRLVARYGGGGAITRPAFSADGKLVAVTTPGILKPGLVTLLDRRGKRLASASCGFTANAGFSANGRWLVVGDLRRACLFELPKLRLLAKSRELRPFAGPDDDLQELQQIEFVAEDQWIFLRTGDGTAAVAQVGGLSIMWKGRGELEPGTIPGEHFVLDRDDTGELVHIERNRLVTRQLTEAEKQWDAPVDGMPPRRQQIVETLLSARLCHVGERSFPIEACAP
jgi:hypothetical protein